MFQSSYTIDKDFRFAGFGGGWAGEAEKHGRPDLMPSNLAGQRLFDHVTGVSTVNYLHAVLDRARSAHIPVRLPYRCDTTSHGRLFEMEIVPESSGGLTVRHYLQKVRPYPPTASCRPAQGGSVCSVCCRFSIDERWRETGLAPAPEMFLRECTVCPYCLEEARRRLPGIDFASQPKLLDQRPAVGIVTSLFEESLQVRDDYPPLALKPNYTVAFQGRDLATDGLQSKSQIIRHRLPRKR